MSVTIVIDRDAAVAALEAIRYRIDRYRVAEKRLMPYLTGGQSRAERERLEAAWDAIRNAIDGNPS